MAGMGKFKNISRAFCFPFSNNETNGNNCGKPATQPLLAAPETQAATGAQRLMHPKLR